MAIDKTLILDNIETTLAAIKIANSKRTNVTTVERVLKTWGEVSAKQMPWIGFAGYETLPQPPHPADGQLRCMMRVKIIAHVNAATPTLCQAAINNLEDDIIGALYADGGRGTDANGYRNAQDTKWTRTADDVGDPAAPDSRGGYGTLEMDWEVTWIRTTGVSP